MNEKNDKLFTCLDCLHYNKLKFNANNEPQCEFGYNTMRHNPYNCKDFDANKDVVLPAKNCMNCNMCSEDVVDGGWSCSKYRYYGRTREDIAKMVAQTLFAECDAWCPGDEDDEQEKTDWSKITDEAITKVFSELPTVKIEKDEDKISDKCNDCVHFFKNGFCRYCKLKYKPCQYEKDDKLIAEDIRINDNGELIIDVHKFSDDKKLGEMRMKKSADQNAPKRIERTALTLREQAAIAAMQGIITSNCDEYRYMIAESYEKDETHLLTVGIARMAVACADALIEELNKD